jgi:hypothetical protein
MTQTSFVDLLVEKGRLTKEDVQKLPNSTGDWGSLMRKLLESQLVDERELCQLMSEVLGIPFVTQDQFPKEPLFLGNLSVQFMQESQFLPLTMNGGELTIITPPLMQSGWPRV